MGGSWIKGPEERVEQPQRKHHTGHAKLINRCRLFAERDGVIVGYAYAGPFNARAAYDWSCELTIYLDPAAQKQGAGGRLYAALEDALKQMGLLNLYACIADTGVEDEYLTRNSPQFHAHLGFAEVGRFTKCGYKFGRWYDMIWMEKVVGDHRDSPAPVTPYPDLVDRAL